MSLHDPLIAFKQMRDHAREAMTLLAGKSRVALETDRVLSLAVVRLLEILGEAARRVPSEMQQRHPSIPWFQPYLPRSATRRDSRQQTAVHTVLAT